VFQGRLGASWTRDEPYFSKSAELRFFGLRTKRPFTQFGIIEDLKKILFMWVTSFDDYRIRTEN
jgi:hypothetical protein